MGRHTGWPLLLTILSLSSLLSPLAAEDTITPGNSVGDGNSLVSADGSFQLGFFTPGRSTFRYVGIWYNSIISVQTVVWVANRDRPLPPDSTGVLSISGDGSLSLSDAKGKVYWLTGATPGLANPVAKLLNSGNLVVTAARSGGGASLVNYAWQSFDYPTDSLLAGMKLGWDLRLGRNRNLTAWKSADDPAPGEYAFAMNVPRDPQIFLVRGTERLWGTRSPWTFQSISGIPGMAADANQLLTDYFVSGPNGLYFWYDVQNRSMLSRVVVQPTGWVEGWVGIRGTGTWIRLWRMSNDFGVRVPAADLDTPSSWSHGRRVVAVTVVAAFLGMLVLGWICWYVRRRSGRTTGNPSFVSTFSPVGRRRSGRTTVALGTTTNTSSSKGDDLDLPLFDFSSIAAATNDFSAKNKLGEGGFGPVYVGQLGEGPAVAVKRLSRNSVQGLDEFKNEVMLIAKLRHRNLVRLLGCCIQREERILVYEYMPNKSLDAFLFDKTKGSLLDWKTRYQIINGIARGLLYLHQDSRIKIIHRDLKASNVLLDKEMNPKISDFGMARMFGGDENEAKTRRVVGTYGYMSPEYIMDGAFSVKSDVFSFGVVVLEIVSGRRNRGMYQSDPNLNLLGYAWTLWKARNWLELVDSSMVNSFPMAEVLKCINVGLLCVQVRPEDRPTMASVVQMLGNDTASLPRPSQPGFMVTRGPFEASSSCSVNEVTVTMLDGR